MLSLFSRKLNGAATSPSEEVRVGFVGKVRSRPDFVRSAAASPSATAMDQWMHEGIAYLARRFPNDWKDRLGNFPALRFFITGDGTQPAFLGVVHASEDSSGRQHPFTFFLESRLLAELQMLGLVPFGYAGYYEHAESMYNKGGVPIELDDLERVNGSLAQGVYGVDAETARQQREEAWGGLRFEEFLQAILPDAAGHVRAAFVRDAQQTLRMVSNRGPQRTAWGMRLPLPENGDRQSIAAFWLAFAGRLLNESKWSPHVFWSSRGNGLAASLTIYFRAPSASNFAQLVSPDFDEGGLVDLVRRPLENMPEVTNPRFLRLLNDPEISWQEALEIWTSEGVKS